MKKIKVTDDIILHNADCISLLRDYADSSFDLAIVDPPYWDRDENKSHVRLSGNLESTLNLGEKPPLSFFDELKRVCKHQIIFGANNFGIPFKGFFVWDKTNIPDVFTLSKCELASVSDGLSKTSKICRYSSFRTKNDNDFHPTSKPIALYEWILRTYAKEGWRILDTHLGSGSLAIACYYGQFYFEGIEINEEYFDKSVQRIKRALLQPRLF